MRVTGQSQRQAMARWVGAAGALAAGLSLSALDAVASPAVERLFEQCARNLQRPADEVSVRCRHYLEFGGDDDATRRKQVQAYLGKAERTGGSAKGWTPTPTPWRHSLEDEALLVPDLLHREGDHRVEIVRTYASAWEGALLRRAEAIYPLKRRSYCEARPAGAAAQQPQWACGVIGALRQAGVASAAALQYYLDWTEAAGDAAKPVDPAVRFDKSSVAYLAAIGYRDRLQIGERTFRRVYLAEVNLGWNMTPHGKPPTGFLLNKIVVFNGDGSVAALFDDHPINGAASDL